MQHETRRHQLIALLLRELRDNGYPLGTAKYLQVQELLRQVPADRPLEEWRNLLAPLFSSTPQEQTAFYTLFAKNLALVNELQGNTPEIPEKPDTATQQPETTTPTPKKWRWPHYLLLIGTLAVVLVLAYLFWPVKPPPPDDLKNTRRTERLSVSPGDTARIPLQLPGDTAQLLAITTTWQTTRQGNRYALNRQAEAAFVAAPKAKVGSFDSLLITLPFAQRTDTIDLIVEIIAKVTPPSVDSNLIATLDLPYPEDTAAFAQLRIDQNLQTRYDWYQRYAWPLKAGLILLLGLLLAAVLLWDERRRAKAVAELQRPDRAPYLWNPETGVDAAAFLTDDATALLTRLRGRSPDERLRLDLPATVQASTRAGGRLQLRYRHYTLPPDFLMLIDRLDGQDHRARLFDALYQVFLRAEVPVARYFYDGDPRLCFDENHPGGISLTALAQRHAGAQLLLVGDGQGLLSTLSGGAAPWTNLLEGWSRRALLLTRPMDSWGRREKVLQALLPVLPASPGGLGAALDLFNAEDRSNLSEEQLRSIPDAQQTPFAFEHELLPDLERHFASPYIDWIAACALWPTLHWDLTLHLGAKVAELNGTELLHFAGLRELTRLPWFVEGRIPDAARLTLVGYLQKRGLETPLRQALRELLQNAPPPPAEATAYDEYRMNLIVNELLLRPDAATRRQLEREYERYLRAGKKQDLVAIKLLNRPATALDVLVGDRLKKYAFREGLPGLGWKLAPKLLCGWLVLTGLILAIHPVEKPCTGTPVIYQDHTYCLNDTRDQLLYLEQLAADAIIAQQHNQVDSLVAAADQLKKRDTAFYENTATRYYNAGAARYNATQIAQQQTRLRLEDSLALACFNFRRGDTLYTRLTGHPGAPFQAAQARSCGTPIQQQNQEPTADFQLAGTALDASTKKGLPNATITLAGQKTKTNARGRYQITLTSAQLQTTLRLKASAPGYITAQLNTAPLHQLPPLLLQPDDAAQMQAAWDKASRTDTPEAYTAFLGKYPNSPMVYEASSRLADFASAREQAAWGAAQKTNTLAGYEGFLKDYPAGAYAAEAQNRLDNLSDDAAWARAEAANTPAACQQYLQSYPKGRHLAEAQRCVNAAAQVIAPTTDVPKPSMVSIPGGSFTMGDVMGDKARDNELPVHTIQLAAFELGRYEVTFAEYDRFCEATKRDKPEDRGWGRGNRPAIYVSWEDATAYCNWLSTQHGYTPVYTTGKGSDISANWQANGYRLPTEAEWEYAARGGGKKVRFGNGKDIADPKEINFDGSKENRTKYSIAGEYRQKTVPVGSLNSPNALGLHDMSGNVFEWCWDWYGNYSKNTQTNPRGSASGSDRVFRGGSWYSFPRGVRAADRNSVAPVYRSDYLGFRLARTP